LRLAVQLFTQELLKTSKLDWHGRGYDVRKWIENAEAAYVAGRQMQQGDGPSWRRVRGRSMGWRKRPTRDHRLSAALMAE
jgi:hypothetical protein